MIYAKQPAGVFAPEMVLNGMPKSGLHLIEAMCKPMVTKMPPSPLHPHAWIGTFGWHSFSGKWNENLKPFFWKTARLAAGHYLKGHVGWRQDIAEHLDRCGIAMVFIYRDLRDVAVSQSYHVVDRDDDRFTHADKSFYRKLGGHDAVLKAVIEGVGGYPGIVERWELFAGWLKEDWVLRVKFEDAIKDPKGVAEWIVQYGYKRKCEVATYGQEIEFGDDIHDLVRRMVGSMQSGSATFRKGTAEQWRDEFKPEHYEAFEATGGNEWLERLGYSLP